MRDDKIPDLSFPMVSLGVKETPWDLRPLLYRGGGGARVNEAAQLIESGAIGAPVLERVSLVRRIHEELTATLVGGGSKHSCRSRIECIRHFFTWVDNSGELSITLDTVASAYLRWSDYELNRSRVKKEIAESTAYNHVKQVGGVLDHVLERATLLLSTTRLSMPVKQSRVRGVQADKQNLTDTFEFGHMLLDISDGLSIAALWGALPLRIQLRSGQELVDWSGLMPPEGSVAANPLTAGQRKGAQKSKKKRAAYENDRTLDTRTSLVNLRIEAELLLFIGQTGMNRGQAHQLKIRHYSYKSAINGYEVRDYKHRRQGEVMFEIFSEYRTVFERYLAWRREVFPNDKQGLLFPLIRISRAEDEAPNFDRMRKTCKKLGIPFISPRHLRNTRVNWLLRRSRDSDVTADIAQHYKQALHQIYEEPSLQVAMTEVARFWLNSDPALPSPAPGVCDGVPVPMAGIPSKAPKPDCLRPSGCLWCDHHRDIDSQDYVWSLSCMRHLKSLALSGFRPPEGESTNDPAYHVQLTLDRLTTKLQWFKQSNELRHGWVAEAYLRIDEGDYHPHWGYLIESLGGD